MPDRYVSLHTAYRYDAPAGAPDSLTLGAAAGFAGLARPLRKGGSSGGHRDRLINDRKYTCD